MTTVCNAGSACISTGLLTMFGAAFPSYALGNGCLAGMFGALLGSLCQLAAGLIPSLSACDAIAAVLNCFLGAIAGGTLDDLDSFADIIEVGIVDVITQVDGMVGMLGITLVFDQLEIAWLSRFLSDYGDWVEAFELDSGVGGGELPNDFGFGFVALLLPGGDFVLEFFAVGDAAVEALAAEDAQFDFRHVEPVSVLRRIVQF